MNSNHTHSQSHERNPFFENLAKEIIECKNENEFKELTKKTREAFRIKELVFKAEEFYFANVIIMSRCRSEKYDLNDKNNLTIKYLDILLEELNLRIDKQWNYEEEYLKASDFHISLRFATMSVESIQDPVEREKARIKIDEEIKKMRSVKLTERQQREYITARETLLREFVNMTVPEYEQGWHIENVISRFGIDEDCKAIILRNFDHHEKIK